MTAFLENEHNPLFYQTSSQTPVVAYAKGVYIYDEAGKKYLDGCSGAVICNIGHGDQDILDAMNRQAKEVSFTYRTQFENAPAIRLAQKLVQHTATGLERVFYVSGGSEAVESAIKLCRSYFHAKKEGSKHIFVSRSPSYHGSTLGALSVTSYCPLEKPYRPLLRPYPKIPAPFCYRCHYGKTYPQCGLACAHALESEIVKQGPENVAGFITEPIGGASCGAVVPPKEYFSIIRNICDKYEVLLIFDEVMTGFARTGQLFAYEHWGVVPDIMALSKGMGAGYYPLGAIMASNEIVEAVLEGGGFPHGHTHAGNPMACAVGEAVFDRIVEGRLVENAAKMGAHLKEGLLALAKRHKIIGDVRGEGLLTALELVQDKKSKTPFDAQLAVNTMLTAAAFSVGLLVYPRRPISGLEGDHVLIAPPLIVSEHELEELLSLLDVALDQVTRILREKGVSV